MEEKAFREYCNDVFGKLAEDQLIRNIGFVGAYNFEYGAEDKDSQRLSKALDYMVKSGVPLSPDFDVDVVNLADKRDYLSEERQYDAVMISFILANQSRLTHIFNPACFQDIKEDTNKKNYLGTAVSPNHFPEKWLERTRSANAKFVITYGSACEVSSSTFSPKYFQGNARPYDCLIPTPMLNSCEILWKQDQSEAETFINGKPTDLPLAGLSYCADRQYLSGINGYKHKNTTLAQKIRETVLRPS
jgi:hypothetical protein